MSVLSAQLSGLHTPSHTQPHTTTHTNTHQRIHTHNREQQFEIAPLTAAERSPVPPPRGLVRGTDVHFGRGGGGGVGNEIGNA